MLTKEEKKIRKRESNKKYRMTHKKYDAKYNLNLKLKAYKMIANFHNEEIKCWRCGETLVEALTIGHINQNGKDDRKINGSGATLHRRIISGKRSCEDLKLECYNCNMCLAFYGKYPDEITEKEFKY